MEATENEESLLTVKKKISNSSPRRYYLELRAVFGCQMTYRIDNHSRIDGGSNCRAIFGISFRAGKRVVIALERKQRCQHFIVGKPSSSRWLGARRGQAERGASERTPYNEPRTDRMTIAKMEITTLSFSKVVRSCEYPRTKSLFWNGRRGGGGALPRPCVQRRHNGLHFGVGRGRVCDLVGFWIALGIIKCFSTIERS